MITITLFNLIALSILGALHATIIYSYSQYCCQHYFHADSSMMVSNVEKIALPRLVQHRNRPNSNRQPNLLLHSVHLLSHHLSCQLQYFNAPLFCSQCLFALYYQYACYCHDINRLFFITITYSSFLLLLSFIDYHTLLIPHMISLPMLLMGFVTSYFQWIPTHYHDSLMGALLSFICLSSISFLFYKLKKQIGIGGGDIILMSTLCAWCGVQYFSDILCTACVIALPFSIYYKRMNKPLPFGPFLSFAGWIAFIYHITKHITTSIV